jgi:hypothetical protein
MGYRHRNKYALDALKDRPATLAGKIYDLKREVYVAQKAVDHIDAAITIFEPGCSVEAIGIKRPRKRVKLYGQGELSRSILDAGEPIGIDAVVGSLLLAQGHEPDAVPALKPRVNSNLHYLRGLGRLTKQGNGRRVLWGLAS